jgi:hypothetical protein
MIDVPFDFNGETKYQNYDEVVDRIKKFHSYEDIGQDQSGNYTMYAIHIGSVFKPAILITGTMHGTEWHGTQYTLKFFEDLRDNRFPDKDFRDKLLEQYHLIFIPMVNPWGMDHVPDPNTIIEGRYTSNNFELNGDFNNFTQAESKNVKKVMDRYNIFAYLDLHMIRGHNIDEYLIIGNGQNETNDVRDIWGDSLESYSGQPVTRWPGYGNLKKGLARRYMRDKSNPYTPYTLSYITEMARPTDEVEGFNAPLTNREIHKYGSASIYLFFKTSIDYFEQHNNVTHSIVDRTMHVRNLQGKEYMLQATTTHDFDLNGNQSLSFKVLPTKVNNLFIGEIAKMWEVIDNDDVVHKIIYRQKKGEGNRLTVDIKAIPSFFDVMDKSRIYEEYNEHMPAQRAFTRIFKGMPFEFIIVGQFDAVEWEGFGGGESRLETFKRALKRYKMEFRLVGNIVYLQHQIGRDTSFQYRHRLNASNIVQEIDANDFWTYAKGYGSFEDGEGGGWEEAKLIREYTSPLAKIIGKREAPPIKDGRITNKSTMDKGLKELVDNSLKISITTDIHDLRKQGYALAQPEIGDRVFIIDERIGIDEEIRIINMSVKKDWKGNVRSLNVTFGSECLSKRHQSNLSTAAKQINELIEGRRNLPFSVLDEAVKNATRALQNAQTELNFGSWGIDAVGKDNPNHLTRLNSRGIGVSDDGGNTFTEAIVAGKGINMSAAFAGTMVADFIAGGTLASLNGNLNFDMDKGNFDMKRANFTLGGGARIRFTDSGNSVLYNLYDSESGYGRLAGMGVGKSVSERYPFAYLGTYAGENMDTLGPHFSGFFANTTSRIREDDSANSVVGRRFRVISDTGYERGLTFDFFDNTTTVVPWGGNVELGDKGSRFDKIFANQIRGAQSVYVRDAYGIGGFRFDTDWGDEGTNLGITPLNTGKYHYNLGRKDKKFTYAYITSVFTDYLRPSSFESLIGDSESPYRYGHIQELTVQTLHDSSRKDRKLNIEPLSAYIANDFVDMARVNTFNYRTSDLMDAFSKRVGLIIEQLDPANERLYKADSDSLDVSSIIYLLMLSLQSTRKNLKEMEEIVYG